MRFDHSTVLTNYKNEPIPTLADDGKTQEDLTLYTVIIRSLHTVHSNPANALTAGQLNEAFQISLRMHPGKPLDLSPEDMVLIKKRVALIYNNPLVYGRISQLFNPQPESPEDG